MMKTGVVKAGMSVTKTRPGSIHATAIQQNDCGVLGLRNLACYNAGVTERFFRGLLMVVASRRGDAVELPRESWNQWSAVLEYFDEQGTRGHKRLAILALRLGVGLSCRVIAAAVGHSEGHVRRVVREEKARLKKNSYHDKKPSAIAR